MYSTTVYLYQQIVRVLMIDTSGGYFTARYDPVYSKSLTINKGVDNVFLFEFINQDQKPVNINGSTFVFRLINQDGDSLLLEKDLEILSASTGRAKVVIPAGDTLPLVSQPASYSIQRTAGNYVQSVFVDDNSGSRGSAEVVDSVMPDFVPSGELTIPDIYGSQNQTQAISSDRPDWARDVPPLNTTQLTEFFSSYVVTEGRALTTVQMDLDTFTGTVKFQGADDYLGDWYDVTASYEFFSETSTQYFNIVGYYPLIRAAFNTGVGSGAQASATVDSTGVVTGISVNNAGSGYVSAPRVQIVGNGADATAVATISAGGVVTGITVTNGGSGYTPLQFAGTERATVKIDNGLISNILYR